MNEQESLLAAINEDVQLHDYDEAWPSLYAAERQRLFALLPGTFHDIEHIGSTSVPGMAAKPIIDILAGVESIEVAESIAAVLCASGYTTSAEFNRSLSDRKWFMRWADGRRTHHLHVVVHQSQAWLERLRFRDALRARPELAMEYAQLKARLAQEHPRDREAYTEAKSRFVQVASWGSLNSPDTALSPQPETGGHMPQHTDAVTAETLQAFADAWNRHDVDALMTFMTEDCVFEASGGPETCGARHAGRAAVRAAFADVWAVFPDAAWGNARHFVSGDRGVSEWVFTGTRADGSRVEVNGCDLFTFRGGKIAVKNSYRKNRPALPA